MLVVLLVSIQPGDFPRCLNLPDCLNLLSGSRDVTQLVKQLLSTYEVLGLPP